MTLGDYSKPRRRLTGLGYREGPPGAFSQTRGGGSAGPAVIPLRFATSANIFPNVAPTLSVNGGWTGPTVSIATRRGIPIGSGDLSELRLNFTTAYINRGAGVGLQGNGYTINAAAIEANGTFMPVTFDGGSASKVIANGNNDIVSDAILPAGVGLTKWARDSEPLLRLMRTFANPLTDMDFSMGQTGGDGFDIMFNPATTSINNPIYGTGSVIPHTGPDVAGVNGYGPIVLGRYINDAAAKVCGVIGDSKTIGHGDDGTGLVSGAPGGMSRILYPTPPSSFTGSYSGCNFGCFAGVGTDWTTTNASLVQAYIKYMKYCTEYYGTNDLALSSSTGLHAVLRSKGIQHIIRLALTANTTDIIDSWQLEASQLYQTGWGPASAAATFNTGLIALVASDFTYYDMLPARGVDFWKWIVTGAANYATSDGVHESAAAYELEIRSAGNITRPGGTTSGTMKSILDALP